jgi:hypothetical protein
MGRRPIVAPSADDPLVVFDEMMEEIRTNLMSRPRDLQKRIGPSEIGEPCDRVLISKLLEVPEAKEGPNWRAWVGTCMHDGLENIFASSFMQRASAQPRFLLEQQVTVGRIGDWDLTGKCDLFDILTGCVWDWKSKSKTQHLLARRHGLGPKYRAQFHCYGLGMANLGYEVKHVGGIFMLRDGELRDSFPLFEPYDPQIALGALERANQLYALGKMLGVDVARSLYPPCDYEFCRDCGNYRSAFGAPRAVETTLTGLLAQK